MHLCVGADICYEFESSVKNDKNNDEKALLRPIFIKFLGHALWRSFNLSPEFTAKWKTSKSYIIQVSFLKATFVVLILETAKS